MVILEFGVRMRQDVQKMGDRKGVAFERKILRYKVNVGGYTKKS